MKTIYLENGKIVLSGKARNWTAACFIDGQIKSPLMIKSKSKERAIFVAKLKMEDNLFYFRYNNFSTTLQY